MTAASPAPRSVAICGSCATRDNFNSRFNPDYKRWYDVRVEAHQSSILAMMSPPIEPELEEADGLSEHEDETLRADLSRSFLTRLVEAQPDFLIIDFSGDTWFGALRLPDGRYLTDNTWKLRKTAYYRRLEAAGSFEALNWRIDPDQYFKLWSDSITRFATFIAEHCPETRVIVHRIQSVNTVTLDETDRPRSLRAYAGLAALNIAEINAFRIRLDEYAINQFGWDSIDLRQEGYHAYADHPWGAFWVHYTFDYHRRFLGELHLRDLSTRVDDDLLERIQTISSAGAQRLTHQARSIRRADKAQRQQLQALEGRSAGTHLRTLIRGPWTPQRKSLPR